ncbi:MAG: hypothetical protein KIT33_04060 [Candidatus Kapabacteria bacterium]|nr:hypothetical protein [Ignavibacteriota bacterium]MCW5884129.1 hypothetical protein [Candidatus Kapabacteria bacterium]
MRYKILIIAMFASLMMMNANILQAQNNQIKILKPKVFAMDLIFANQLLNTIELRGSEVDALIEVKNVLKPYVEQIQKENIALNNPVSFDIPAAIASNLLQFMERGKITGADVEKYKRFVDAVILSAKENEGK